MKALYFSSIEKKLRYGDGRSIEVGVTHTVECTPKCCEIGLHASVRAIDALRYAPGAMLYLVRLGGKYDEQSDKIAATSRTYIDEFDASELLREFARKQALINIQKIEQYCCANDYKLIKEWLKTGNEKYRSAARSAVRSAARSAAWAAAESAAWSAAESAAWSAAESAAREAGSVANIMLCSMIEDATGWDLSFAKG